MGLGPSLCISHTLLEGGNLPVHDHVCVVRVETGHSGPRQAGTGTGAGQVGPRTGKGDHLGSCGLCGWGWGGGKHAEGVGCRGRSAGRWGPVEGLRESGCQTTNIGLIFPVPDCEELSRPREGVLDDCPKAG